MDKKYSTTRYQETQKVGKNFAKEILKLGPQKQAVVLALNGDLGAGKTTFSQGFAKGLGVAEKVLSPTFVVMKKFKLNKKSFKYCYHFDCYRLKNHTDIIQLGFNDIINNPGNIVLIEWPEKIKKALPKKYISILFKNEQEGKRKIVIT